ncbi:MAG: helix-turn-helix domain-containing protein [Anaerobacillus sp.]|uniref:helix-turn-helix domain-containing protein n=1 Tax=Anaerobacillus sp. TaxID=1872506 RepID=UPI0039189B34
MKKSKMGFFFRLMLFILLVSTLPIVLLGTFSYIKASNAIYEKVIDEKAQSMYQIRTNVEQVIKTVDHSLTFFVNSSFLVDTIRKPMHAEQFRSYRQMKHELNYLQTFDTGIKDISIISLEHNWLINNEGLKQLNTNDIEDYGHYLSSSQKTNWIFESAGQSSSFSNEPFSFTNCNYNISLVKQLPLTTSKKTGLAIASIPSCYLANLITAKSDNEQIMILDSNLRIISHNDTTLIGSFYENDKLAEKLSSNDFQSSGQLNDVNEYSAYTLTFQRSHYNGWLYLSVISNHELKKDALTIGYFTLYMCIILFIICLIISWYGSKKLYKPINQLYKSIFSTNKSPYQKDVHGDEFTAIGDRIHDMLDVNKELEEKLQGQIDQLKQLFMRRLLDGQLGEEELLMKYLSYNYNERWQQLCALTIQIDSLEGTKYTVEQKDLLMFTINTIVEEFIPHNQRLTPILRKDVQVLIILSEHNTKDAYETFVHDIAFQLLEKINEELDLSVSIGVSQPFTKLSQSRLAYLEAMEALKYRIKFGSNSILYFKDVNTGNSLQTYFPENLKNELFDAIKLGDKVKVEDTLRELISTIFSKDLSPNQYQIALMRLLNDLIVLMQTLGVELENLDDKKSLFDQLFELSTIEEIERWFNEIILFPLVTSIEERITLQYKNISDKIIHIIQQEYDTDISLEAIAERLHYNSNYLSSIFRKETNISFSDYLAMYRLNMAKKWLVESELSIKEIAEMFHYNNSQNFIRSFKKKEGITPGKYRELHSSKKFD